MRLSCGLVVAQQQRALTFMVLHHMRSLLADELKRSRAQLRHSSRAMLASRVDAVSNVLAFVTKARHDSGAAIGKALNVLQPSDGSSHRGSASPTRQLGRSSTIDTFKWSVGGGSGASNTRRTRPKSPPGSTAAVEARRQQLEEDRRIHAQQVCSRTALLRGRGVVGCCDAMAVVHNMPRLQLASFRGFLDKQTAQFDDFRDKQSQWDDDARAGEQGAAEESNPSGGAEGQPQQGGDDLVEKAMRTAAYQAETRRLDSIIDEIWAD